MPVFFRDLVGRLVERITGTLASSLAKRPRPRRRRARSLSSSAAVRASADLWRLPGARRAANRGCAAVAMGGLPFRKVGTEATAASGFRPENCPHAVVCILGERFDRFDRSITRLCQRCSRHCTHSSGDHRSDDGYWPATEQGIFAAITGNFFGITRNLIERAGKALKMHSPLLLSPAIGQCAGELCEGEIGRRGAVEQC